VNFNDLVFRSTVVGMSGMRQKTSEAHVIAAVDNIHHGFNALGILRIRTGSVGTNVYFNKTAYICPQVYGQEGRAF